MLDKICNHFSNWYLIYAYILAIIVMLLFMFFHCDIGLHSKDSEYCGYCGQFVGSVSPYCSICGEDVGGFAFCRNCGNPTGR